MHFDVVDDDHYLKFTRKQRMDRHLHELEGVLRGIALDGRVSDTEVTSLRLWLGALGELRLKAPIREMAELVEAITADGVVDSDELEDLKWALERWTTPNQAFDAVSADIQRLTGIIAGVLADGRVDDGEIVALSDWLDDREHLRRTWPYEEIGALLTHVRADKVIDDAERLMLKRFLADLVPSDEHRVVSIESVDLDAMTVRGVCAVNPEISLAERTVCFTGKSTRGSRASLRDAATRVGGVVVDHVSTALDYLVIGADGNPCWAFACYGRKIEQAMHNRRRLGSRVMIVHEVDFWDAVA